MLDQIIVNNFSGGISPDQKVGVPGSFRFARNLNIHEDSNYVTLQPKLSKVSGDTVVDLVTWAADGTPFSTDRYFYDQAGKIYKETSGGTWSLLRTVSNASGNGFLVFDDYLYYALDAELGRYGLLSGTPAFSDSFLSDGTTDKDQSGGSTGATDYVPPTTISEAATARQTFTPERDPLKAVIIDVDVVGSGDWTVTVHNKANTSIGTKTIANGSMSTGDVTFTFATPLRMIIDNEYHFHVTSTVADGGVDTSTASDLEAAEFSTLYGILISDANWHPIIEHLNGIVIGNERYLAFWDQALYNPNQITLAAGFNVRSLAKVREYVVADCWRGTDVQGVEEGRRYYWDGIETTWNFYQDLPVGLPNAVYNSKNREFSIVGSKGKMYLGSDPFVGIQEMPNLTRGKKCEIFPGAVTDWNGRTMIGVAGSTDDSTGLEQGVYEFGNRHEGQPEVLNYAMAISTGTTQATTLKIGMVKAFGKDLYVGWEDTS